MQLSCKNSPLVTCNIFRIFLKTFSANDKYFLLNRDNSRQPIQTQLPEKEKTFSEFFSAFFKSSVNCEYFQKKDDPHS